MTNGKITVIAGPMFSGKTGKLMAMVEVFTRMGDKVLVFKPAIDDRFNAKQEIQTHDNRSNPAVLIGAHQTEEILAQTGAAQATKVVIDEVQFFDKEKVIEIIKKIKDEGIHVIAGGLLYDYKRLPFGATNELMGLADERLELFAVCQKCGSLARHSERMKGSTDQVDVGAADKYIAVCEKCHVVYR